MTDIQKQLADALGQQLTNFESQHALLLAMGAPEFVAMRDKAHEALAAYRQQEARGPLTWQPIETAPTDVDFLAYKPNVGHFVATILCMDHANCEYDGGVHESWTHKHVSDVTHWMPLPPAPDAAHGIKGE